MAQGKNSTGNKPHVNVGTIGHVDHGKTLPDRPPSPPFWPKSGGAVAKSLR